MAYVRQRGNQLAIVHGVRDAKSKKVEQEILFTLYSKREALEALGKREVEAGVNFQRMLETRHPHIKFDWQEIQKGIKANLQVLPDLYDYKSTRLRGRFREELTRFAKQLMLTDPQHLISSSEVLSEHRGELEYVQELIHWRLASPAPRPSKWNDDNDFYWRFDSRDLGVPPDVEEHAAGYYARGEYARAKVAFKLLTEGFEDYADGHNYLGLIALNEERLESAVEHFEKTVEVGRRLLPKRLSKGRWWSDIDTRPYMRGLRNLALALNQIGRYEDALDVCNRLEKECYDTLTAAAHRASAYLNLGNWQSALDAALLIHQISPTESLVAALAAIELQRKEDARTWFTHAALNTPRTVAILLDARTLDPSTREEAEDHNGGVTLFRSLSGFLKKWPPASRRFVTELWNSEDLTYWREELDDVTRRWREGRTDEDRAAFDRMTEMQTLAFAQTPKSKAGARKTHAPLRLVPPPRGEPRRTRRTPKH